MDPSGDTPSRAPGPEHRLRAVERGRPALEPLSPFQGLLEDRGFVVLDGGLATALEARGHRLDTALWSARLLIDDPGAIRDVHRAYVDAGADCVTTGSYQASFEGFAELGLDAAEVDELLRASVRLGVEAGAELVAASIGPYGAYLADGSEYDGRYGVPRSVLRGFHERRMSILADTPADMLACETIPSGLEAEVLLGLLDGLPDARAWLSFSCRDGRRLWDGTPLADVAAECAAHEGVVAVGVNCTAPHIVAELLSEVASVTDLPLVAYPNSGEQYDASAKRWSGSGADPEWLSAVDDWWAAGARIVGGCCRIGPGDISALRARLVELRDRDE